MKYNVVVDGDNRVINSSADNSFPGSIEVNAPDDFDVMHQSDYRVENGGLVYDKKPPYVPAPSAIEILAARQDYLAMMMGVEL